MQISGRTLFLLSMLLLFCGCDGPLWQLPGGALSGQEAPLGEAKLPAEGGVLELETAPAEPYSVHVGYQTIEGGIYIDPAAQRGWYQRIQQDPLVRVRFEDDARVYLAVAVEATDPEVLSRFAADRIVLQLAPR